MSLWQAIIGAGLGGGLGYAAARIAPRWLSGNLRPIHLKLTVALNAGLCGVLAARFELGAYFWTHLIFISLLTLASLVDLYERIIPNEVVVAGLAIGLLLLITAPFESRPWSDALIGSVAAFGFFLILAILVKGGMGFGDVKLAAVIGLFLGVKWVGMGLVLSFLAGGLVGVALLVLRRVGRKAMIPFGPFLAIGAVVTVLYGVEIWTWYTGI